MCMSLIDFVYMYMEKRLVWLYLIFFLLMEAAYERNREICI
jgi:hypothetical protein